MRRVAWLRAALAMVAAGPWLGATAARALEPSERVPDPPPAVGDTWVLTPAKEAALGEKALSQFLDGRNLSQDGSLLLRVDRIGRRLAGVSDRPDTSYRFLVVQGKELQGYSFPGGTICLPDATVKLLKSDDEIAFAVGHEMAHLSLRHHAIALRISQIRDEEQVTAAALLARIQSRFDQSFETEADRYGALYAMRAGFAFSGASAALTALDRSDGPRESDSHPSFVNRIEGLKRFKVELERSLQAFEQGVQALGHGRYEEAIDGLTIFVAQFPQSLEGRINLGAAYLARVRNKSGTPGGLAEALPILPESAVVLRGALEPVDIEQAGSQFIAALGMSPDHPWAHAGLSLVELRRRRPDEARRQIDLARRWLPQSPEILLCAGNVEYLAGGFDAALALYQQALSLRRDWAPAIKNASLAHEQRGDTTAAREGWTRLASDATYGTEARTRLELLSAKTGVRDRP